MKSCLLCGVGGQGIVLASRLIAAAAMAKGQFVRTGETIGMSQRGGCVVSHVRVGECVPSPMIPFGQADVLLALEPGEAVRNLVFLKPDGVVIVCDRPVRPVMASLSGAAYDGDAWIQEVKARVAHTYVIDSARVIAGCGSTKGLNVALLGALAQCGAMNLNLEDMERAIAAKVKPTFMAINQKALALGASCVS